jgi:hypothetical protein
LAAPFLPVPGLGAVRLETSKAMFSVVRLYFVRCPLFA